jgi:OmpA-OmpF porin, OOP family
MKRAAIALGMALAAGTAGAQETGYYAGASLGGYSSNRCDDVSFGVSCDESAASLKVFGGYQLNRNLALEAGYINTLINSTLQGQPGILGPGQFTSKLRSRALDLVAVPTLPIGTSFALYGKLGLYFASTEEATTVGPSGATCCVRSTAGGTREESNGGLTLGAGFAWHFTRQLSARADWQRFQGVGGGNVSEVDVDTLNVGVLYRF